MIDITISFPRPLNNYMNFNELHNISSSILHEVADTIRVDGETYYYYKIGVPFIICKGPGLPFLFLETIKPVFSSTNCVKSNFSPL